MAESSIKSKVGASITEAGQGLQNIIGGILGLPGHVIGGIGDFLKDPGAAIADSVTPEGNISVSTLFNMGGKRDLVREHRAQETKLNQIKLEAAQRGLDLTSAKLANVVSQASPDVQAQIANLIGGPQQSPPQGPTVEADITRHETLAPLQLNPEDIARHQSAVDLAAETYRKTMGLPSGTEPLLSEAGAPALGKSMVRAAESNAKEDQAQVNRRANILLRERQRRITQRQKQNVPKPASADAVIGLIRSIKAPQTEHTTEMVPSAIKGLPPTPLNVTKTHIYTDEELQTATQQAMDLVEQVNAFVGATDGTPAKGGTISLKDAAVRKRNQDAVKAYLKAGLSQELTAAAVTLDTKGPRVLFGIPPKGAASPGAAMQALVDGIDTLDSLQKAGVQSAQIDGFATFMDALTSSGYSEPEAKAMIAQAVNTLRKR